ncbi:GNAT family N-acetyltransferase [Clostridium amazonitimonense]|uniref:GNAT family N-acetyltransferase n=1 Tax=Clostridium amazonitimonense TaxID=1499689 RepID=UPI00050995C5|nr:GNAT family N-acetyltransferase [Clostridium amazonitimonense]
MEKILIREMNKGEEIPYELLLLADPSREIIKDYINRGICYLGFIENSLVGVYILLRTRPFTLELVNVAVDERHQGKGIGKTLVLDAISKAREKGAKTLEIGTGNSSIMQLALYQKCGLRITGIDKDFFKRHYKEKILENGIECIDMIRLSMDL